ncbi:hypothetical protein V6C27_04460 [Peptococcaceae bacterium 1198_IL3148]
MDFQNTEDKLTTDAVNLITNILYRYQEVAMVNLKPLDKALQIGFWLSNKAGNLNVADIKQQLMENIEVFNLLDNRKPTIININHQFIDDYIMLEVERDLDTLVQREITLVVLSLQQLVKNNIIIENTYDDQVDEEMHEDIIDTMLFRVKNLKDNPPLLAFREEGRVLVYNSKN